MTQQKLIDDAAPEIGGTEDHWPTPESAIAPVLDVLPKRFGRKHPFTLIEPAAGEGAMLRFLYDALLPTNAIGVEINPDRYAALRRNTGDYAMSIYGSFFDAGVSQLDSKLARLWITNPPYSEPRETIGWEFVTRCLELSAPIDCVAMLLPCDYSTGVKRAPIHELYPASYYPLKRRPRFANGRNGKRPVAWFVWDRAEPLRRWRIIG